MKKELIIYIVIFILIVIGNIITQNYTKESVSDLSNNLENLIIFLVPEIDFIGGGVMSVSSIAKVSSTLENIHHSKVMLCTVPSERTFFKYSKFFYWEFS